MFIDKRGKLNTRDTSRQGGELPQGIWAGIDCPERARSGQKPFLVKFDDLRLVNPFDFVPENPNGLGEALRVHT